MGDDLCREERPLAGAAVAKQRWGVKEEDDTGKNKTERTHRERAPFVA